MADAKRPSILAPPGGMGHPGSRNAVASVTNPESKLKSPAIPLNWPEASVVAVRGLIAAWEAEEFYESTLLWSDSEDDEDPNVTHARSVHEKYAQASANFDGIPDEKKEKEAALKWCRENMPKAMESLEKWKEIQRGARVVGWTSAPPSKKNSDLKQ